MKRARPARVAVPRGALSFALGPATYLSRARAGETRALRHRFSHPGTSRIKNFPALTRHVRPGALNVPCPGSKQKKFSTLACEETRSSLRALARIPLDAQTDREPGIPGGNPAREKTRDGEFSLDRRREPTPRARARQARFRLPLLRLLHRASGAKRRAVASRPTRARRQERPESPRRSCHPRRAPRARARDAPRDAPRARAATSWRARPPAA